LTAANQELEAFTYSVAHDLRAPLRHIDAFTRILQEDFAGSFPPEAAQLLETIRRGSENMSRLVNDLLNLAHVGRQEMKKEQTSLNRLIEEVILELKRETEGRDIEWRVADLPAVEGDPGLLKQVFANLLSNSVKYSRPRQQAIIEIGLRVMNEEPVIYVRDNGVGFNMKYADKLFGVFQRLHRAEEFEGTGVGLAIVERVIKRHRGHIWAESEVGKGATFYFSLDGLNKIASQKSRSPQLGTQKSTP
jgi:light-regulated signal transduction histidine kinase (bacteriophytochrome)